MNTGSLRSWLEGLGVEKSQLTDVSLTASVCIWKPDVILITLLKDGRCLKRASYMRATISRLLKTAQGVLLKRRGAVSLLAALYQSDDGTVYVSVGAISSTGELLQATTN